jgi:hypothetical protein
MTHALLLLTPALGLIFCALSLAIYRHVKSAYDSLDFRMLLAQGARMVRTHRTPTFIALYCSAHDDNSISYRFVTRWHGQHGGVLRDYSHDFSPDTTTDEVSEILRAFLKTVKEQQENT